MFETVADFRRMAETAEAGLTAQMVGVAARVAPPFTRQRRQAIALALQDIAPPCAELRRIWTAQMMLPEARALRFGHPDRSYFQALDGRLRIWNATQALLTSVLSRRPQPLMPEPAPADSAVEGQMLAYQRSFERLHGYFSPTPPDLYTQDVGRHGDLPYPFTKFFRLMQLARRLLLAQGRRAPLAFLDVGCGVGLKLVQAAVFFDVVHGLEYDPGRAEVAATLVDRSPRANDRASHGDALTFDGYGMFDVIYAYKPLSDPDLLQQMEARIVAQARPGAILILPYFDVDFRFEDIGLTRIHDTVFLTGGARQDIRALLRRAGDVGTVLPSPDHRQDEGFAGPVREALRHWGHLA